MGLFSMFSAKKAPAPVEPVEDERLFQTGIGQPFWTRIEKWGILRLMQDAPSAVLWTLSIEEGKSTPVHRHACAREVICVTAGRLMVREFDADGQKVSERAAITGDVYHLPAFRYHQILALGPVDLVVTHFPDSYDLKVSSEDVEEWKPPRVIGRG